MKKILLKSVSCIILVAMMASCSSESDIELAGAATPERQNRSGAWDGIIGEDRGDSVYEITADKLAILADLEAVLDRQGDTTELETLEIVKKAALNDSSDFGYMLIAGDTRNISIAVMLARSPSGSFKLEKDSLTPKTTSCRGCASGCNLEYLYIDGKKIPICNENGCVADCTKTETEL